MLRLTSTMSKHCIYLIMIIGNMFPFYIAFELILHAITFKSTSMSETMSDLPVKRYCCRGLSLTICIGTSILYPCMKKSRSTYRQL